MRPGRDTRVCARTRIHTSAHTRALLRTGTHLRACACTHDHARTQACTCPTRAAAPRASRFKPWHRKTPKPCTALPCPAPPAGVHVSKVRSCTLDVKVWEPSVLQLFQALGNTAVNGVFESRLLEQGRGPGGGGLPAGPSGRHLRPGGTSGAGGGAAGRGGAGDDWVWAEDEEDDGGWGRQQRRQQRRGGLRHPPVLLPHVAASCLIAGEHCRRVRAAHGLRSM